MDNTLRDFFTTLNSENKGYKEMITSLNSQDNYVVWDDLTENEKNKYIYG